MTTQQLCLESQGGEKPCGMWHLFSFQYSVKEIGEQGEEANLAFHSTFLFSLFFFLGMPSWG